MKNICLILRGISGSGKSSFSRLLESLCIQNNVSQSIHSTDTKFMVDGEYKFDAILLRKHHNLNFQESRQSMIKGTNLILIDNCSLRQRDFRHYAEEARLQGYLVAEVIFYPDTLEVHYARNLHSLPKEALQGMLDKFNSTNIPSGLADIELTFYIFPKELPGCDSHVKIFEELLKAMGNNYGI